MVTPLLTDANPRLERALKYVSISDDASERLKYPKASLKVSIPVRMDDGALRVFEGYECIMTTPRPYKRWDSVPSQGKYG
jgi:glutamate dehydrogenase (NADP+)